MVTRIWESPILGDVGILGMRVGIERLNRSVLLNRLRLSLTGAAPSKNGQSRTRDIKPK
jgi:hypothetical protein